MASAANFQTNQSLPFYPTGNVTGAILTLTQARPLAASHAQPLRSPSRASPRQNPCNDPFHRNTCCAPHDGEIVCANWTGAHAISAGAPRLSSTPAAGSSRRGRSA